MSFTGDGKDYNVWYEGRIIDNVKAVTLEKAQEFAYLIWGRKGITVTPCADR